MKKMSPEEFAASTIERAWEPPEEVVVPFALAHDPVLQPEDYGVLIRLLLRDPGKPAGVAALAKEFQESGWKMGDSRLRGVMARLKKAGHVNHRRAGYDEVAGRPVWAFAVYRNPANNPQYVQAGAEAASQVRPTRGNPTRPGQGPRADTLKSNVYAGQADTLDFNALDSDTLESNVSESNVYAGQADTWKSNGRVSPPPHPPEEEDSSSPNPLTGPARSLPSQREQQGQRERVPEFTDKQLRDAAAFLAGMQRWQAGAATARRCAPRLLRAMRDQGWPLLADLDDAGRALLEADVLKNTQGAASWAKCLPGWVDDLRLYAKVKPRAAAAGAEAGPDAAAVRLALVAACTACDPNGWLLDDDDDAPMRRCTHQGVTVGAAGEGQR
ncbi:hypothetical protein [Rhodococcus qingshengii]|uniref:hypothetical protein n=1 Tax=Rhodococcus qingshengii TaxID=334542 RepID=UPI0036F6A483